MRALSRTRRGPALAGVALLTALAVAAGSTPAEAAGKRPSKSKAKKEEEAPPPVEEDVVVDDDEVAAAAEPAPEAAPAEPSGAELDAAARASFDAGKYREAASQWSEALARTPESKASHMDRSVILTNAVRAHRQVYAEERDRQALYDGREQIYEYMRQCKRVHNLRCNSYPETDEARALLAELNEEIDASEAQILRRPPPEYNTVIGGKPIDVTRKSEPPPRWTIAATVGGVLVIGGGAYLTYYAATDPKFKATSDANAVATRAEDGTGTDTGTDTGTGTTSGTSLSSLNLDDETKGKLFLGLGVTTIAVGVGFIIIGAMGIAKNRRANRRESLAFAPALGPNGGGLMVRGRF